MLSQRVRTIFRLALLTFLIASTFLSPVTAGNASNITDSKSLSPATQAPTDTNILVIPSLPVGVGLQVDGTCDKYAKLPAAVQTFSDGGATIGKIYFIHSATVLYVCMRGAQGSFQNRFGRVVY